VLSFPYQGKGWGGDSRTPCTTHPLVLPTPWPPPWEGGGVDPLSWPPPQKEGNRESPSLKGWDISHCHKGVSLSSFLFKEELLSSPFQGEMG